MQVMRQVMPIRAKKPQTEGAERKQGASMPDGRLFQDIYKEVVTESKHTGLRQPAKVPYGSLAKDGVIEYNGVCFVCDERTNSICLGDVTTDRTKVLIIGLSGGGQLKVNRDNLGDLARAIGMFSPEDVNRILRAIAQDAKLQSMKKELEDMEAEVGETLRYESEDGSKDEIKD